MHHLRRGGQAVQVLIKSPQFHFLPNSKTPQVLHNLIGLLTTFGFCQKMLFCAPF